MAYVDRFILMIKFFTRIPMPFKENASPKDYGKGLIYAPIIGLIIGDILAGAYILFSLILPTYICAAIIVVLYLFITGGLHFDGLADTFDGVFSNKPKDKILEIMRDSRVGTNALLAVASILILDMVFISGIKKEYIIIAILLFPVAGRLASLIGAGISKYARSGEGLGKSFIEYCGAKEIIIGLIIYFIIFYLIAGVNGLIISLISPISAFISVKVLSRKIGGATGDILGAALEINQTIFLLAVCILQKIALKM